MFGAPRLWITLGPGHRRDVLFERAAGLGRLVGPWRERRDQRRTSTSVGAFAHEPRARHHEVESRRLARARASPAARAGRSRARRRAHRRRPRPGRPPRRRRRPGPRSAAGGRRARHLVPGGLSTLATASRTAGPATTRATRASATARGCAGTRWRTDSGRPQIGTTSTRPARTLRTRDLAVDARPRRAASSEPRTAGRRGRVAEPVRARVPPVPVVLATSGRALHLDHVDARRRRSAPPRRCAGRARGRSSRRAASRRSPGSVGERPWPRDS